jgi:hypothetical protein
VDSTDGAKQLLKGKLMERKQHTTASKHQQRHLVVSCRVDASCSRIPSTLGMNDVAVCDNRAPVWPFRAISVRHPAPSRGLNL